MELKKRILVAAAFFSVISLSFAMASENSTLTDDVKKLTQVEEVQEVNNSISEKIKQKIEAYAERKGIHFGEVENGRIFTYAIEEVNKSPSDPRFGQSRVVAFERAWLKAQKDIASYIGLTIASETIRDFYSNDSEGAENIKVNNWEVFKNKILGLSEALVNKALEKLGVNPNQYGKLSLEKRKELLHDRLIREIAKKTSAQLAGTFIVQTFEGEEDGTHAVGVVVMYSPKLKYIANAIARGYCPTLGKKVGHPVSYYLPKNPSEYISTWGVRVIIDESGKPALLSFGQWSHPYSGNNKIMRERNRKYAREKANLLAESYISEFLNSFILSTEKQKTGEEAIINAAWKDGDTFVENMDRIIDERWEKIKRTSRARISGLRTVTTKLLKLPGGQEVAVAVKFWNCAGMEGAKALKKKYTPNTRTKQPTKKVNPEKSYIHQGKDMTEINDF